MKLKLTPIASAVALALASVVAIPALAQQAPQAPADTKDKVEQLETVEVTGIRGSLEQSLKLKHAATSHVEVITAEDVGKMPDKNVADSLQRVPGVTTSSAGATEGGFDENDRISMRGTNPSLTQTLINGHNLASGDWFVLNQVGQVGRSVSYTLLPSELVGSVVVHKSAQARDIEGGVVGTVDVITRKPLEFRKSLTLEASGGVVHATLPDKTDPQFSALVNWKNDANTVGVLVQGFSETRHLRRDGQELLGYEQIGANSNVVLGNPTLGIAPHPDLAGVWYPVLIGSALFEQERKRQGGLIDIQVKPTKDLTLDFNGFTSHMDASNYNRNYMMWATHFVNRGGNCDPTGCLPGQSSGQAPDPGYVVRNGTLVSANFAAVPGTQYGIYDQISRPDESADTNFFNFDARLRVTDALTLTGQLGTSRGSGKTPTQDVAEWNTGVGSGAGWNMHGISSAADWNLGTANNSSPAGVGLGWIFGDQNVNIKDKEDWTKLDGEYALDNGILSSLQFGARYNKHDRTSAGVIGQGPIGCCDATNPASAFDPVNFPQGYSNYPSNYGSGLGGSFPTGVWYYTPGQLSAYNAGFANRDPVTREDWNSEYSLKEKDTAGYVQANMEHGLVSGNLGLRFVRTEEHVVSNVAANATTPGVITTSAFGNFVPTAVDHTYNDALPSANLKLDLSKDLVARFSASKTMTRADYSALAAFISLTPPAAPGATGTGSGGNPDLKPVRSNNLDATIEWYFAPRSLLSAGIFYMDLSSYIGFGHVTKQYMTFNQANPQGFIADYNLTVPTNSSGKVNGFELAYEQPIAGYFGVAANYTYTDAKETGGGPLVGASKNTYNLTGYFENDRWSVRLAYNFRSSFYSGLDRSTAFYQDDVANVAASVGYKVTDNVSLTFDAHNLNDPTLKYYALNKDQPRSIYKNGRQYYLNARIKF